MEFNVKTVNDAERTFTITFNGIDIQIDLPLDVDNFSQLSENDVNIIVGGILLTYKDVQSSESVDTNTPFDDLSDNTNGYY
jgi:hypothetical protein